MLKLVRHDELVAAPSKPDDDVGVMRCVRHRRHERRDFAYPFCAAELVQLAELHVRKRSGQHPHLLSAAVLTFTQIASLCGRRSSGSPANKCWIGANSREQNLAGGT